MISPKDYEFIAQFLKQRSGLLLTDDKHYLLESRLLPLMARYDIADFASLVMILRSGGSVIVAEAVVEAMTTNESLFFRDKTPFDDLARTLLPTLCGGRLMSQPIRIWCAACSTGQEPYSLAMMLSERPELLGGRRVEILATDISNEVLDRARAGRYNQFEVQRGLSVQQLLKYFTKSGDWWEVVPKLRGMVEFRRFNLLDPYLSLGMFDIIMCRNVLIYFDAPTKSDVFARLSRVLMPDGYLQLGGAETVIGLTESFRPLAGHRGTYVPTRAEALPLRTAAGRPG